MEANAQKVGEMSENKENVKEEIAKVKGLGSVYWFASFCMLLVAGILYALGYRMVAGIAAPVVFLAITIPALRKSREFEKANKDEMFNLAYGKICAHLVDSAVWMLLPLIIALYLFPEIPAYIVLAFVEAVIYGSVFFRYCRWLGGDKR